MNMEPLAKGDRVDWRDHRDGEVLRVGRATLWAVFQTTHGSFPVAGAIGEFRRHQPSHTIRVGDFYLRAPGTDTTKVQIHWERTGEMMETDAAKLESWMAKFWAKEF